MFALLRHQVVMPSTYEGKVAAATQQLLMEIQQRQQQLLSEQGHRQAADQEACDSPAVS